MCTRTEFDKLVNGFRSRKDVLLGELSNIDLKLTDLNHIIELGTYTNTHAVGLIKMLKESMCKRRLIKNELDEIEPIINQTRKWKAPKEPAEKVYTFRVLNTEKHPNLIGLMANIKTKVK